MKRPILAITILAAAVLAQIRTTPPKSQDEKMHWFREAKFGLFIHWGLYAVPAGEWKGQPVASRRHVPIVLKKPRAS